MAEHGAAHGKDHPAMDYPAHEDTYKGFIQFTEVGVVATLAIVTALAVGGVKHAWLTCIFGTVLALITAAIGIAAPKISWRAPAVPFVLMLLALLFMPGAPH
jgi:branched-subunit amino acid ABC-type transport system permease component